MPPSTKNGSNNQSQIRKLVQLIKKLKRTKSDLTTINLSQQKETKKSWNIRNLTRPLNCSAKHWGLVGLAIVVILSNFKIATPANIGGADDVTMRYRTIAEIASTATLIELGNPLYTHEEYTTDIGNDGEYLFKTNKLGTVISRNNRAETITYIVRSGENLSSLASDFGLTTLTIKYANNISGNLLKVGQELRIPPIDGIFVKVNKNDSLSTISNRYQVKIDDIVKYNNIDKNEPIFAGQELLIPGAIVSKTSGNSYSASGTVSVPSFKNESYSGKFIWPTETPTHYLSQGYSYLHKAIDLPRSNGLGIYASAPGIVQTQSTRSGYGNLIIINHGDGWSTYYGHLSEYKVSAGQYVEQGQLIGIMGSTGRSTGPHLHFEIRQNSTLLNPLNYLPR